LRGEGREDLEENENLVKSVGEVLKLAVRAKAYKFETFVPWKVRAKFMIE
jgi:hypothetical protein